MKCNGMICINTFHFISNILSIKHVIVQLTIDNLNRRKKMGSFASGYKNLQLSNNNMCMFCTSVILNLLYFGDLTLKY